MFEVHQVDASGISQDGSGTQQVAVGDVVAFHEGKTIKKAIFSMWGDDHGDDNEAWTGGDEAEAITDADGRLASTATEDWWLKNQNESF